MRAAIEALEGRALFAAGGGAALIARAEASSDPAVQATLELVQADQAAVQAGRQALATAKAKFRADRQQLRATLATARETFRADTAEGRAELRDAQVALREHLKHLRLVLRSARNGDQPQPQTSGGTLRILESAPGYGGVVIKLTHRLDTDLDGIITPNDSVLRNELFEENRFHAGVTDLDGDEIVTARDAELYNFFHGG